MDVRPRGIWQFIQRDSGGDEYIFNGMYHEIMAPTRLVYTFEFEGMPRYVIVERVTFEEEEQDGKTKLTANLSFKQLRIAILCSTSAWVDVRQKAWIV